MSDHDAHAGDYVVDDDDVQECRYMTRAELYEVHVDNPVDASVDAGVVTLTYRSGHQWQVRVDDIGADAGSPAVRFRKTGGLAYPTDGWSVVLNATTVPRLAALRRFVEAGTDGSLTDLLVSTAGALD